MPFQGKKAYKVRYSMNNQSISRNENGDTSDTQKSGKDVAALIYSLLKYESFCVLSTQAGGKPYGSLVAFAFERDMKTFVFGTPTETRKYRNLKQCDRVALVVDSRAHVSDEINRIEAVTITGKVLELKLVQHMTS